MPDLDNYVDFFNLNISDVHIDGLAQHNSNSIANTLEKRQYYIKPAE